MVRALSSNKQSSSPLFAVLILGERNPSWDAIGYFPKVNEEKINQLKNNCDELRSKVSKYL